MTISLKQVVGDFRGILKVLILLGWILSKMGAKRSSKSCNAYKPSLTISARNFILMQWTRPKPLKNVIYQILIMGSTIFLKIMWTKNWMLLMKRALKVLNRVLLLSSLLCWIHMNFLLAQCSKGSCKTPTKIHTSISARTPQPP